MHQDVGPARGSFLGDPLQDAQEAEPLRFTAEHPVATLRLEGAASSSLGGDAAVRVTLLREGAEVADLVLLPDGSGLALRDLEEGRYEARFAHEAGHFVSYRLEGNLTYRLPVPERLRDAPDT